MENCVKLWEVLSEIKMLNHLRIDVCTMNPLTEIDVFSRDSFVQLALKFICLKELELMFNEVTCKPFGDESRQAYPVLLSHFPSLVCCFAQTRTISTAVDIIKNCKYLKRFKCRGRLGKKSLPTVLNKHLQYLDIHVSNGNRNKVFMDSVSAHGKLEIVILAVPSVTENGITALIKNSPKLHLFKIHFFQGFFSYKREQLKSFKDTLKKKWFHRKLFNLDGFIITGYNRSTSSHITI